MQSKHIYFWNLGILFVVGLYIVTPLHEFTEEV